MQIPKYNNFTVKVSEIKSGLWTQMRTVCVLDVSVARIRNPFTSGKWVFKQGPRLCTFLWLIWVPILQSIPRCWRKTSNKTDQITHKQLYRCKDWNTHIYIYIINYILSHHKQETSYQYQSVIATLNHSYPPRYVASDLWMADQIPCQAGNILWKGLKKQVVRGVTQEMTNHSINSLEDETSLGCEKKQCFILGYRDRAKVRVICYLDWIPVEWVNQQETTSRY